MTFRDFAYEGAVAVAATVWALSASAAAPKEAICTPGCGLERRLLNCVFAAGA